jgi:dihydroflavonol-4-reductase
MNIAVTGANGHVGINLCRELLNHGHKVKALTHMHDSGLKHLNIEQIKGDILVKDSLQDLVRNSEIVIHLAAKISIQGERDSSIRQINVDGTRNILQVSRENNVKRFIHFSSIHAFEQYPQDQTLDETRRLVSDKAFAYDMSKAEGEKLVMEAAKDGFDSLVLCPTAIIGPADYEPSLTGKAMIELYNRQIPALVPGGYNWVDVRDIVQGCIASIERGKKGEKYLLSGQWRSLKEIATMITHITGRKTTSLMMPFWVAHIGLPFITFYSIIYGVQPLYTGESLHIIKNGSRNISNEKARNELGFSPRNLEDTLTDLFYWFKENEIIT